jgi:hypothetical protein
MSIGQELKDFVGVFNSTYAATSDRRDKKEERRRNAVNDPIDNEFKQAATENRKKENAWYDRIQESNLQSAEFQRAAQASQMQSAALEREWAPRMNQSTIEARQAAARQGEDRFIADMLYPRVGKAPPAALEADEYLGAEGYEGYAYPEDEAVNGYAEGGLVEEDEEPRTALPTRAPVPPARPVTPEGNAPAPEASGGSSREKGFSLAYEAVREGAIWQLAQMGLADASGVQDPDRAAKMAEFLRGRGAAPKAIIDQAYDAVDPDKSLPESERTMAALGTVYSHYIKRGEPEKAKAAAASIVQHQRSMFQTYSAIAKAAMEGGDIEGGLKAAVRAYSAVPDGKDMKAVKQGNGYAIQVTDEATGKVINKQVYTPQEIGGFVMNVNPASFDEFIMTAAGERKAPDTPSKVFQDLVTGIDNGRMPTNKEMAALPLEEQNAIRARIKDATDAANGGPDGGKPASISDVNTVREGVQSVLDQMLEQPVEEGSDELYYKGLAEIPEANRKVMAAAASDIVLSPKNRSGDVNVTEQDALEAAMAVMINDPETGEKQYTKSPKGGGMLVTLPDEREVWMPMARFKQLDNINRRNMKDASERDRLNRRGESAEQADEAGARRELTERRRTVVPTKPEDAWSEPVQVPQQGGIPVENAWSLPMGVDTAAQPALDRLQELLGRR